MGAVIRGRRFGWDSEVDPTDGASGCLNIAALASGVSGTIFDLLDFLPNNTTPVDRGIIYPTEVGAQFRIVNASGTDGYDLDVRVKFSYDGTDWADTGEGDSLGNFYSATPGDDLNWSNEIVFVPQQRFLHFEYDNSNATNPLTIASRIFPKW